MGVPGFGVLLARLLNHRRSDAGSLARAAGVAESGLWNVLDGRPPSPSLLNALAPALGLRAADLYVMAGQAVPDKLAPVDTSAAQLVVDLVADGICLPAKLRAQLRHMARSLPQEPRRHLSVVPKRFDHEAGFGAMLGNMLYGNRNLDQGGAAEVIACLTNGRMYVSPSTVVMIGAGRLELTADRLAGFATVLGVPAGDLAAITGIDLRGCARPRTPRPPTSRS